MTDVEQIDADIREIHSRTKMEKQSAPVVCEECFRDWPCPTIKALDKVVNPDKKAPEDGAIGYAAWAQAMALAAMGA